MMQRYKTTACWFWILKYAYVITSDESVQISGAVHFLIQIQSLLVYITNKHVPISCLWGWVVHSTCYILINARSVRI